jgi:hypothetical protein
MQLKYRGNKNKTEKKKCNMINDGIEFQKKKTGWTDLERRKKMQERKKRSQKEEVQGGKK